jgi:hypothetical protein
MSKGIFNMTNQIETNVPLPPRGKTPESVKQAIKTFKVGESVVFHRDYLGAVLNLAWYYKIKVSRRKEGDEHFRVWRVG